LATRSTSEAPRKRGKKREPTLIGWREWAGFPDLGVERIKAKVDTGAKTSAIHAYRIVTETREGELWATFTLHPAQKKRLPEVRCAARIVDRRRIRSSNGAEEARYIIETRLRLGAVERTIELSLARRDEMGFRLLLGRDALRKRFLVDPGASFLLGK